MIPYGKQNINEDDILAVVNVLKSDFLTQGPVVPAFERDICEYTGAKYGVAVNSGTSALHIACLSLELGEGDWLWTTPVTFVASANCGLYCGAKVDFVDIDSKTWNISIDRLEEKLKQAQINNRLPKILVAVHFGGLPCNMETLYAFSKEFGFNIVEDACHAIGGKYKGQPIGNCKFSDITIFSFHPVKTITSGEGGMAVTNDCNLAKKMSLFRNHGITRDPSEMINESHGPWYYQQVDLGFNYRMTDIHAALGISQLKRLDIFVERCHEIAARYDELLAGLPLQLPLRIDTTYFSGMHLYVIRLKLSKITKNHRQVFEDMREQGIGVNLHYIPIHIQLLYKNKMGFKTGDFPEAESYYKEAISLPLFFSMSEEQQDKVVSVLHKVLV